MFSKYKKMLCGLLMIATLSSGFAHAQHRGTYTQQESDSKSTLFSLIEGGANFIADHRHLLFSLAMAPYLISNRATVIEGAQYGADLFSLNLLSIVAMHVLLPSSITEKKVDSDEYSSSLGFYNSVYLAPLVEELVFRGIIQNISMFPAYFIPILTEPLLLLNACVFGGVHALNGHDGAYIQAINIALIEYTVGLTRSHFSRGLAYTMGMHIANNAIVYRLKEMLGSLEKEESK